MDPIQVNINVTLDVSEKTAELIQSLIGAKPQAPAVEAPKPERKTRKVETKPAPAPEVKPDPAPEVKEDPKPAEAPEDLPPAEITDEQLREAVYIHRNRVSPTAVRAVFDRFGIHVSNECPQEKRAELIAAMEKLSA